MLMLVVHIGRQPPSSKYLTRHLPPPLRLRFVPRLEQTSVDSRRIVVARPWFRLASSSGVAAATTFFKRPWSTGYMTYVLPDKTAIYGPGDFFFESGDINHIVFNKTDAPLVHVFFEILPVNLNGPSLITVR